MRFSVYALVFSVLGGCSGQNIVAGDDKTQSEQLASSVPSFCASLCPRLRACPADDCTCDGDLCECFGGVDDGCERECAQFFSPYVGHGEACAVVGKRLKSCLDQLSCDDLGSKNPCAPLAAEEAMCPSEQGSPGVEPSGPTSTGGTTTSGPPPSGGPSVGPSVVTCSDGSGVGAGAGGAGSHVVCEAEYTGCSDGHDYSWVCAEDSEGLRGCTCFQDRTVVGAFAPGASCPELAEANAGCNWALTQ